MTQKPPQHESVLKKEILDFCASRKPQKIQTVVDGTLGLGGHAEAILSSFPQIKKYFGFDLDSKNLDFARKRLQKWQNKTVFINRNFAEISEILPAKIDRPVFVLLDLGVCSTHLDDPERGFTFAADAPLQMSFTADSNPTAAEILNTFDSKKLAEIFQKFGEEPAAKKLASKIEVARKNGKIFQTTFDLTEIIEKNTPPPQHKKTKQRVFQSLRIAVNNELGALESALDFWLASLQTADAIAVISYHSLEDRTVKKRFARAAAPETRASDFSLHEVVSPASFALVSKKPIQPTPAEIVANPRSRSAKLRILTKI